MIGTKILNHKKYEVNTIVTEDGQQFISLDDLYQFLPKDLIQSKQEQLAEDILSNCINYINKTLIGHSNLKLYSTTKHYGVKLLAKDFARKDTLFYILKEQQSYLTLPIKECLLQPDVVTFKLNDTDYRYFIPSQYREEITDKVVEILSLNKHYENLDKAFLGSLPVFKEEIIFDSLPVFRKEIISSIEMFFAQKESEGLIFKVHQQRRYRNTLTLRPLTEEQFKFIIDYLFEDAVLEYKNSK